MQALLADHRYKGPILITRLHKRICLSATSSSNNSYRNSEHDSSSDNVSNINFSTKEAYVILNPYVSSKDNRNDDEDKEEVDKVIE